MYDANIEMFWLWLIVLSICITFVVVTKIIYG